VVAHRHPLFREGVAHAVKLRPELELVAETGDGREVLVSISTEQPDVALVDRALMELTGEQVLNAVRRDGL
jgi:DNA-binding NarL/FixJ family response regulator